MRRRVRVKKHYTVTDVKRAQYNLEPLICPKCRKVGEVTYLQYVGVGFCGNCGHENGGRA
jgi:uncharacterized CHY-type Zn-finger protein